MLIAGNAILRFIVQFVVSSTVMVPGFVLLAVFSNWVLIHTSPTPGVVGLDNGPNAIS